MPGRVAPGPPPATIDPAQRNSFLVQMLVQRMGLNDEQHSQASTIITRSADASRPIQDEIKKNRDDIRNAVKAGKNKAALDPLIQKAGALHAQISALEAKAYAELCAVFTPEQRTESDGAYDLIRMAVGPPIQTPKMGTPFPGVPQGRPPDRLPKN
jgi:hypothetical protein